MKPSFATTVLAVLLAASAHAQSEKPRGPLDADAPSNSNPLFRLIAESANKQPASSTPATSGPLSASGPLTGTRTAAPATNTAQATATFTAASAPANANTAPAGVARTETEKEFKPTIIRQAGDYSETNQVVSFFVLKGKKNEGNLTGDDIARTIANYFTQNGIPVKGFVEPSEADNTAIGFFVKGRLYGPVGLRKAAVAAVGVGSQYRDAYSAHFPSGSGFAVPPSGPLDADAPSSSGPVLRLITASANTQPAASSTPATSGPLSASGPLSVTGPLTGTRTAAPATNTAPATATFTAASTPANANTAPAGVASTDTTEQKPTLIRQAGEYSETNRVVSIIVSKGKQNESGLTGEDIARTITAYFTKRGIPAKAFVGPSEGDYTAIGYAVKGRIYGPVGLDKAVGMAVVAGSQFRDAYADIPSASEKSRRN
ncbi:MAG: hypothetical protein JNN07_21605 [Verrucomicrobiales bacterium]|nr:hypothetical protein [Verrucomicrobiales bacterium]